MNGAEPARPDRPSVNGHLHSGRGIVRPGYATGRSALAALLIPHSGGPPPSIGDYLGRCVRRVAMEYAPERRTTWSTTSTNWAASRSTMSRSSGPMTMSGCAPSLGPHHGTARSRHDYRAHVDDPADARPSANAPGEARGSETISNSARRARLPRSRGPTTFHDRRRRRPQRLHRGG